MYPAGDGYDGECARYCGNHDGEQLAFDDAEAFHQPDSRRHKEKSEIAYKEVGDAVDLFDAYDTRLEGSRKQQHSYDARRHRNGGGRHDKLAGGEEGK